MSRTKQQSNLKVWRGRQSCNVAVPNDLSHYICGRTRKDAPSGCLVQGGKECYHRSKLSRFIDAGFVPHIQQTIERLIGCQSLFSTFERQFAFRRVDILGLSILLAWLLSPLGGQSSLRLLTTQPLVMPVQDTITYFPIEGYGLQSHIYNTNFVSIAWPLFAPLFMSALLTSKQYLHAPMDQFGNLNIPDIFQLEGYSRDSPPDTWIDIPKDTEVGYTSLIGIPIVGLPHTGNTSFELVSHYWSVECEALATKEILKNETLTWITSFDMTINYDTEFGAFGDSRDSRNRTKFAYETRYITSQVYQQHANLTTYRLVDGRVASAACWAFPLVVESRVICQGRSCTVLAMRRLGRDTEKIIDKLETSTFWFQGIADSMPRADQSNLNGNTDASALVEHWMMDPNLSTFRWDRTSQVASSPGRISKRWVELSKLPSDLFNRRLQVAVNTYWQSALGSAIIMGNLTKSQAEDLKDGYDYTWNTTELTGTREDGEKYICNVKFAIITIAISLLLLAAAIASLVLGIFTKAPDTLGFVSTSARDNPYVTTQVASHLDGLEAARALQDMRIRIGDVNSTADIGHVAFASMDAEPKRVSRKRLYN